MAQRIEIRCCGKVHPRVEGWSCWRHLFTVNVSGDIVTISKTCPACKVENSIKVRGKLCPESVEVYLHLKEVTDGS